MGTNDTPTSGAWSPSNNTAPSNMVQVRGYQYDGGGVGDSNLTQVTDYPGGSAANRVSQIWYDWRDRPVARKGGVQASETDGANRPILVTTYDNLDEVTQTQQYTGDGVTPSIVGGVLQPLSASLLRAQENFLYDEQGRVYQTQVFNVNPSTGAVSTSALTTNDYYDHRGNRIAESAPGGLWSKTSYDGAGRETMAYTSDGAGGTTWSAAGSVASDTVLEQAQTIYDADSNVIETITRQRFHNAVGTGALGTPTTGIGARVSYAAAYYDSADRLTNTVDVGTNGGTAWTRPATAPASSATVLVTSLAYNSAGWVQDVTDPKGIVQRTLYDNLGRVTKTIQNYTGGVAGNQNDVATEYGYDGNNHLTFVQADQPGGSYQKTAYVYGVTTAGGSGVNSNDMLSAVQHPDKTTGNPSSSQQDSYLVNALGQVIQSTDRNGNVHQLTYDVLGRLTTDAVTTLGTGVDGAVRRIEYKYDSQGNNYLITSYDAAALGNIVNQVQRSFNGLGQLTNEYQSHSGAVNTTTTPQVQYAYTEMAAGVNNSRLTSMTYPAGYVLNFNYNTGLDSNISRLSSISDSLNTLESHKYLGLATVVERDHPQNNVNLTYIQQTGDTNAITDGGDQYTGLDRFGRIIDQNWLKSTTGASTDRFQYGYNADSDVLYRQNLVNAAMSELYQYDNLHQLTLFQRGTLNATHNGIVGTPSHSQSWTPDALGNFTSITTDSSTQTRTANQQNEYTSISGSGTITYDANGNITADGSGKTFVYDAWNRLVAVKNGTTTLAAYSYDGLGRRITETHGSTTTDLYLSAADQVLEERQGGVVQARNVWSPVYVNALILRDQSSKHNGTLDQRLYAQQDANWNVTAFTDTSGNVVERYDYDAYGVATVLNPDFSVRGSSTCSVPYGFQGMRTDSVVSLQFADNRVYSPTLMRWLQTDPIGLNAGNNYYAMEGNGPANLVDPSGLDSIDVKHITKPENVPGIIEKGFVPKEAGLTWFSGEGSGPGFPPQEVAKRPSSLTIRLQDANLPELSGALVSEAEKFATEAVRELQKTNTKVIQKGPTWYRLKWEYIMKSGGEALKNGFKVKDGGGFHYALTKSGLECAKPQVIGGTADVIEALANAGKGAVEQTAKQAAAAKWAGKSVKAIRIGGRVLFVVAVAADVYEIYQAENKAKTITTIVGGWTGAFAGAWAGGELGVWGGGAVGVWFGGAGAAPGAAIGGTIGSIGGGIGGYFTGRAVTETVYEWIFERGVPVPNPQ